MNQNDKGMEQYEANMRAEARRQTKEVYLAPFAAACAAATRGFEVAYYQNEDVRTAAEFRYQMDDAREAYVQASRRYDLDNKE